MYIAGSTTSADYPVTLGAVRQGDTSHGFSDIAVTKLSASGSSLVFSAVTGGSENEQAAGIAVDSAGDSFVTGTTRSTDFPVTAGALNDLPQMNGSADEHQNIRDEAKSAGSALSYSAVIGGTGADTAAGIAVDSTGAAMSRAQPVRTISRNAKRLSEVVQARYSTGRGSGLLDGLRFQTGERWFGSPVQHLSRRSG